MTSVVVTGAAGDVGRRVVALLSSDHSVDQVIAIDREPASTADPKVQTVAGDLDELDLKELFADADVVIHLATSPGIEPTLEAADVHVFRAVLDAVASSEVGHLILATSALVYGAWANNPVPLTEDAPLRPNPGFAWAAERAEIERLAREFVDGHPGLRVSVVRPAMTVSDGKPGWLPRAVRANALIGAADEDPPQQFVHVDDVASAIDVIRREDASGAFNVAPDSWIPGETVRALGGGLPKVRLPAQIATRFTAWRYRWRLAPTPPGLVPYTMHPWVVANDRLRSIGWEPEHTNEEAYVASHASTPWETISPQRRQEIALGAAVAAGAGVIAGIVALVRRRRRRTVT